MSPLHLRIFLSSPGDVAEEREAVRSIADQLQHTSLLKGEVTLDVVAWDDPLARTPLHATETPQASIEAYGISPAVCDLTVIVLWSRLGTPLPESMLKENGERYASGTERELEDARAGGKTVFIYHCTQKPTIEIDDPDQEEKQGQYRSLQAFLAKLRAHDGSLRGGVNQYARAAQFKDLFRQHLERYVRERLDAARRPSRPARSETKRFRIFLASAADDLRTTRMRLVKELGDVRDIEVLKEVPPPLEQRAHEAAVLECMKEADLCVSLLGNQAGFGVEWEESNWTYPLEQARLGLSLSNSQLVLHPPGFDAQLIENPAYRKLIDELNQKDHPRARLELVQCSTPQMVDAVLAKRREIEEARRRAKLAGNAATAFVDVHANDQMHAGPLVKFLPQENITPLMIPDVSTSDMAPTKLASTFAENLRRAQLFIVIFGQVGRHWVDERLNEGLKLILSERLTTKIGVYIAPPRKDRAQVNFPFPVINSSSHFDEPGLKELLGGAGVLS